MYLAILGIIFVVAIVGIIGWESKRILSKAKWKWKNFGWLVNIRVAWLSSE